VKFSVITPSYNQGRYIGQTIESVLSQAGVEVEHWVIDGGSDDETVDVLARYASVRWISEPDRGQADALQKGLGRCRGDIVGWINSDDYYEHDCFRHVAEMFREPDVQWVIGNLAFVFDSTGTVLDSRTPPTSLGTLLTDPDILRQQCTFFRRTFLERAGGWNSRYHMTMDYDLWTRLARLAPPAMIDRRLAYFRMHADQKTSLRNVRTQMAELTEIMRREGAPVAAIDAMRRKKQWFVVKLQLKTWLVDLGVLDRAYLAQPLRLK
jgi:glycosyltransferase involved in cell wall biosynthesis